MTILACPGITPSFTSHGSPNDTTQYFIFQFVFVLSFETNILLMYPHSHFIKFTITFDILNGVNVRFVHRVLWASRAFQIFVQFLDPQIDHQGLINLFWGVYIYTIKQVCISRRICSKQRDNQPHQTATYIVFLIFTYQRNDTIASETTNTITTCASVLPWFNAQFASCGHPCAFYIRLSNSNLLGIHGGELMSPK